MIIKIENEFEIKQAKEMVSLLGTKVIDELKIGDFILNENTITRLVDNKEKMKPSDVVKEIQMMTDLISKDALASDRAFKAKDFSLCLPKEESQLAKDYIEVFTNKYDVWYAEVIDIIWLRKQKEG